MTETRAASRSSHLQTPSKERQWRARATKIVLVSVGLLLFADATYRVVQSMIVPPRCTSAPMLNALLATMGVCLLLAARDPAAYRPFIMFAGWSSLVHAAVMAVTAIQVRAIRLAVLVGTRIWRRPRCARLPLKSRRPDYGPRLGGGLVVSANVAAAGARPPSRSRGRHNQGI